jgi:hypothetical protein
MSELSLHIFQDSELLIILLISLAAIALLCLIYHFLPKKPEGKNIQKESSLSFVTPSRTFQKLHIKDWFLICLIAVPYAIVSFWQLGSAVFPVSTWQPSSSSGNQDVILELTDDTDFSAIYTIYSDGDDSINPDYLSGTSGMSFAGSNDGSNWEDLATLSSGSIYEYTITEGTWNFRYIKIHAVSKTNTLTEIGFRNAASDGFLPVKVYQDDYADSSYPASLLIDEQDTLLLHPTYYDQAYFDEIYHPRNASEISTGHIMYATVHPLFGTNLIALSIRLFGMNPLAWRLPGAITGVLIIPLIYAIAKLLFKKRSLAAMAALLCACDFMHLTTSRIGTLEPFSIFFILLMFYFMIKYYYTSFYDTSLKKTLKTLLFCGIAMGIAISTKWTACYSAVGLAILLFANLFRRMYEYFQAKKALQHLDELTDGQAHEAMMIRDFFWKKFWITIGLCFLFFIAIPIVIYWLTYLPDRVWKTDTWSIANVWSQNMYMYNYHINLKATHPYSSTWYMWIVDARPIWYNFSTDANGLLHSISCYSNPLLTWGGIIGFIVCGIQLISHRNREAWVILVGYLTALMPWLIITRCVFAYHFYPASCFLIFAVVFLFSRIMDKKWGKRFIILFLLAYVILFYAFLPSTAGFGTVLPYIKSMEWFGSWYFG